MSSIVTILVLAIFSSACAAYSEKSEDDTQRLLIVPSGTHTKPLGSSLVLTCTLEVIETSDTDGMGLIGPPVIRWRGPDMEYISDTTGRVHVESQDSMSLRLYVNHVQSSDTGLYICESDYEGELQSNDTKLSIYEGIRFANTSTYVEQKIGSAAVLECAAFGQPAPELSWRFDGKRIDIDGVKYSSVKDTSLRIADVQRADNGTYECRAEVDSYGELLVRDVQLNVLYAPVFTETPQVGEVVIKGMEIAFRCVADGSPSVKYEWIKEQKMSDMAKVKVPLTSPDPNTYVIQSMDVSDEGRYVCRVSNKFGTREAFVDVHMLVRPVLRNLPPERRTVVEGGTLIAACEASGIPEPTVHWSRTGFDDVLADGPQPDDPDVNVDRRHSTLCRLVIQNVRRSHGGNYTCTANNDIGTDSRTMNLVVEYQPSIVVAGTGDLMPVEEKQYGWPGQTRRFSCSARGLPQPIMAWARNSQPVANNEFYRITVASSVDLNDEVTTTSVLEVTIGMKQNWLYGSYTCIAKNSRGHSKKVFQLQEADAPEMPGNVTIVEERATWVTLHIGEQPTFLPEVVATLPRPPVTSWLIEYERETSNETENDVKVIELENDGRSTLTILDLVPDTVYTIHLSARNAVGFGAKVKFRVSTTSQEAEPKEQSDGPARGQTRAAAADGDIIMDHPDALKKIGEVAMPSHGQGGTSAGLYAGVVIGIMAALAVAVTLSVGAVIRLRRKHNADSAAWYRDIVCCTSERHLAKDDVTKTLKTPPVAVVRRNEDSRLHSLMFWKRWSSQSPEETQQAGPGWPTNDDMGPPSRDAADTVAPLPAAAMVIDRNEVTVGVGDSSKPNGSPDRTRIHSPLLSGRQQQQPQRAPGTPPPTVFRQASGRDSPLASPQAWKCLKSSPHGSTGDATTTTTTAAVGSIAATPVQLGPVATADSFPEPDWQLKRFLESPMESIGRESYCDRSYHDVLDGYHSEDNIDDNEDDEQNYTVAVRLP